MPRIFLIIHHRFFKTFCFVVKDWGYGPHVMKLNVCTCNAEIVCVNSKKKVQQFCSEWVPLSNTHCFVSEYCNHFLKWYWDKTLSEVHCWWLVKHFLKGDDLALSVTVLLYHFDRSFLFLCLSHKPEVRQEIDFCTLIVLKVVIHLVVDWCQGRDKFLSTSEHVGS
jgi:hypothetical protein